MTDAVVPFGTSALVLGWKWKQSYGPRVAPSDMETRHLFHTLRMIWNNSMPAHMRVGKVKLYSFDPDFYTTGYMRNAVIHIGRELFRRKDIRPEWKKELDEMASWYAYADFEEVNQKRLEGPKEGGGNKCPQKTSQPLTPCPASTSTPRRTEGGGLRRYHTVQTRPPKPTRKPSPAIGRGAARIAGRNPSLTSQASAGHAPSVKQPPLLGIGKNRKDS